MSDKEFTPLDKKSAEKIKKRLKTNDEDSHDYIINLEKEICHLKRENSDLTKENKKLTTAYTKLNDYLDGILV